MNYSLLEILVCMPPVEVMSGLSVFVNSGLFDNVVSLIRLLEVYFRRVGVGGEAGMIISIFIYLDNNLPLYAIGGSKCIPFLLIEVLIKASCWEVGLFVSHVSDQTESFLGN